MVNDAAHLSDGPSTDRAGGAERVPSPARFGGIVGADVELIGRGNGRHARHPVAAGSGPFDADPEMPEGPDQPGGASPAPVDFPAQRVDDYPSWSYGAPIPPAPSVHEPSSPVAVVHHDQAVLPLEPSAPPAPPVLSHRPVPAPTFGPMGRPRSALAIALLSVVTLGVYALVWHHRINRELEEFDPRLHSRPGRSTLAVAIPWLIGLLVTLAGAGLVVTAQLSVKLPFDPHVTTTQAWYLLGGLAAVPYLTLALPFSAVAVAMTLERLRCVEEHVGTTTDRQVRPVGNVLLLALPIVGGLILMAIEQRRLNAVWASVAPAGYSSR